MARRSRRTGWAAAAALVVAGVLVASGGGIAPVAAGDAPPPLVEGLPGDLHLNEVQYVGSHNSYHREPRPALMNLIRGFDPDGADQLEYSHAPIPEQLGTMGVRQLELDVFADAEGGRYAAPAGGPSDPEPPLVRPEMDEPGFKVLHIQDIDYETTCTTLVRCLTQVHTWSDANPGHLPIAILIEAKDEVLTVEEYGPVAALATVPEPIDDDAFEALDDEIRSVFDEDELFTPDDLEGSHDDLEAAVQADDWPTLEEAQGQVLFLLDNGGTHRSTYLTNGIDGELTGQPMFVTSPPGQPTAAYVQQNDPIGGAATIQGLVDDGYVVRTRADEPTFQARSGDPAMSEAALASGAQWVSTDYPVPGISARFGSTYFAALPGFHPGRCNPVSGPDGCADPPGCRSPFLDVGATHPFLEDVCWLTEQRVSTGYVDRTFRTSAPVSRQAMAAFLHRFAGDEDPGACPPAFSDVPADHAFFEDVCWLVGEGITDGYPDGTFRPSAAVTRQAMSAFLYRFAEEPPFTAPGAPTFGDVGVSHPFRVEIEWLADEGISTGTPASPKPRFKPSAAVSRQAMAAFLHRFPAS
jgi:hypothetical protein